MSARLQLQRGLAWADMGGFNSLKSLKGSYPCPSQKGAVGLGRREFTGTLGSFFFLASPRQADGQRSEDHPGALRDPRQTSEPPGSREGPEVSLEARGRAGTLPRDYRYLEPRTPLEPPAQGQEPRPLSAAATARRPALQRPQPPKRELWPPPGDTPSRPHTSVASSEAVDTRSTRRVEEPTARPWREALLPAPFRPLQTSAMDSSRSPSPQFAPQKLTDKPPLLIQDENAAR